MKVISALSPALILLLPIGAQAAPPRTSASASLPKKTADAKPNLAGTSVKNSALGLEYIVPTGWELKDQDALPVRGAKISLTMRYIDAAYLHRTVVGPHEVKWIFSPQFSIFVFDQSDTTQINRASPEVQEEISEALMKSDRTDPVQNLHIENTSRVKIDGETAIAHVSVYTQPGNSDYIRDRTLTIFRNRKLYIFMFRSKDEDFDKSSPIFVKIAQNIHFMESLKDNPAQLPSQESRN